MELRKGGCAWIALCLESRCRSNFSLNNSFFFSASIHLLINQSRSHITEPAKQGTRLLDLGPKLYPNNVQRMLHKNLTQFMQSLSHVRQNQVISKRKALLAGGQQALFSCWLLVVIRNKMHIRQCSYQSLILLWFVANQLHGAAPFFLDKKCLFVPIVHNCWRWKKS